MCSLYTLATTHESVRQLFKISRSDIEDWKSNQSIYPDQLAPVVTQESDDTRTLTRMRWGLSAATGRQATGDQCQKRPKWILEPLAQAFGTPLPRATHQFL